MPSIEDWVKCPLDIIQRLYESKTEDHDKQIKEYFSKQVKDKDTLNWIPSLNDAPLHDLKTNTLVRLRCMIQDMYDPEFYLGVYEVRNKNTGNTTLKTGKYKDLADCPPHQKVNLESPNNVTMDRQTLYCVPIPGETSWVKGMFGEGSKVNVHASGSQARHQKRSLEEEPPATSDMETDDNQSAQKESAAEARGSDPDKLPKKEDGGGDADKKSSKPIDLNFPLLGEKGPACIVKVYDSDAGLKLNEIVEFIGVLSNDPALVTFAEDKGDERSAFVDAETMESFDSDSTCPPPSLVPRLHALVINRLPHNNPLLPDSVEADYTGAQVQGFLTEVKSIREEMLAILERALMGDRLAAEYLLCHLISNVYARQDVVALGKYSLNLSGCPRSSAFPQLLHDLLAEIVSKIHHLPMTLTNMNTLSFLPRKDYVANRLTAGVLQLSERTHLVVDETALQPGQLETKGVANITALGNVVCWQKLEYDFNFHKQDFPTNVITLVLSEGKSILKCDSQVAVVSGETGGGSGSVEETFGGIHTYLTPALLTRLRTYVGLVQLLPYTLPEAIQKSVEQDFVEARKDNAKNMSVDDFHALLVLARLVSLSHGQTSLSMDHWEKTKLMEAQRKGRLPKPASTATSN